MIHNNYYTDLHVSSIKYSILSSLAMICCNIETFPFVAGCLLNTALSALVQLQ